MCGSTSDMVELRASGFVAPEDAERYRRLRVANVVVALVMGAQALAVLLLSNDLSLPVFASYLRV